MSTPNPAVELATRQHETANQALEQAREAYEAVQARVAELADDASAEDVTALASDLETAGQALEDAHVEAERTKGNLEAAERRANLPAIDQPVRHATARGSNRGELTYRKGEHTPADFVRDAFAVAFGGDPEASERIQRSNREQRELYREQFGREARDVGTGALAGFTIPQYLIEEYAPLARAGAPFLASLASVTKDLPEEGMVISVPRGTTGTAVAAQSSENSAVQETDFDDTKLDVDIRQYAGQNDLSRQAVQRSRESVDTIFGDLIADWWTKVDSACLNGAGTSGTVLGVRSVSGINSVTYTDASPTVAELYAKIGGGKNGIIANRHAPPLLMLMHGTRWEWILIALDSSNRPLAVPGAQGPFNALAVGDAPEYGAVVGSMQGLAVVTDNNIPTNLGAGTNEDVIVITRPVDHRLWLDPAGPRTFSFEQSNAPQSVRLAVWGEVAFTAGRYPAASSVIGGTGLVAPSF
jgi:HK97 family phage major capsid protein